MNKIKILPVEVYSKIAAGEVIDRPSSIVRELIDNSIDADSTEITIKIEKGGIEKISIIDNGYGIDKDDLPVALSMHATSKIEKVDDLLKLYTMGFRGEALYSIQSVSKISITSNTDSTGKKPGYVIKNNKKNLIKSIACKKGTKIDVEEIFYNIPARKKFLKSQISEWNSIKKVVINKALSSLNIMFKLYHNDEIIFMTNGNGIFSDAFFSIFKNETNFDIFNYSKKINNDIKINLFYSSNEIFFSDRKYMNLFVNNRPITASFFYSAVDSGIRNYISPGRYPLIYIYIDINPSLIDINIHPAKKEIKFINQNDIFLTIQSTIAEAFSQNLNRNIIANIKNDYKDQYKTNNLYFDENGTDYSKSYFNEVIYKDAITNKDNVNKTETYKNYNILGVCFDTYIIVEKDKKILFIDQHAVSESILYIKKKEKYEKSKTVEKLLIPAVFDIEENIEDLENKIELLNKNGFLIEKQEGSTYALYEVPGILLNKKDYQEIIDIIIEYLVKYSKKNDKIIDSIIIEASCKEAVKKGDKLSLLEIAEIVDEFFKLNITNCPHGRPVHFELSQENLEKVFQRKK